MQEEGEKNGVRIKLLKDAKLWQMKNEEHIIEVLKAFTGNNRKIIVSVSSLFNCKEFTE